ncbi:MAG: bifunctional 2-polyprenyl-6-hydroxyphenol methylase/3-demethylubiquinol 3-O-methyltransferase UbiG [Hyphomicrobiaceae bacterium]|nr:bifunctional 2-polyprenyl-6-hydroxyphenol methylase/3-demethylubiquinol 3-O-methyltransferase UbiG [Hyphomicrobiaceae bacterium]
MYKSNIKLIPSTNIDDREVKHFSSQADGWWDPSGFFRPLHQINPLRLRYIRDQSVRHFNIEISSLNPLKGLTCLDIGCGGGLTSEPLTRMGAVVTAIDPSEENIATARAHALNSGLDIDYRIETAEQLTETGIYYDLVLCLEVVEHVPDQSKLVKTVAKLVRPGGIVIMSTINRTLKSYALAIIGAEYILRWLPIGTHRWNKFLRPYELQTFMNQAGLDQFSLTGIVYDPLQCSWSLSGNTDVNYMVSVVRTDTTN